jgi:hypothetical protein
MAKPIQTFLSDISKKAVEKVMEKHKAANLSKSGAINTLVERSIRLQAENKRLKGEILDLKSELGTHQDDNQQEMREGGA